MAFGVFIHRADSAYADEPARRYQFPAMYLSRATATVGDWIVYYEPTKVPLSKGYYAVARVEAIVPDPTAAGLFFALMVPGPQARSHSRESGNLCFWWRAANGGPRFRGDDPVGR